MAFLAVNGRMRRLLNTVSLLSLCFGPLLASDGDDPSKFLTTEWSKTPCRECHASAFEVWKDTTHATGFNTMHRKDSARKIAEKMGYRLIKRDSVCLDCHYTAVPKGDELRAVSGVSCESCHGPGEDWVNLHNDYGEAGATAETESPEHRRMRIKASREAGMRRSDDIYELAATCYQCHTVPNEKLVNQGEHGSGSGAFELLSWTQGKIRHNFLDSFLHGDGSVNAEREPPRRRRLFITGKALAVEYALRAMAEASEPGRYAKTKERSVTQAVRDLGRLQRKLQLPELETMLATVSAVAIKPNNGQALRQAADKVGNATQQLLENHADADLSAADALIDGTAEDLDNDRPLPTGTVSTASGGEAPLTAQADAPPGGFQPGKFAAIGPARCLSCHAPQEGWWYEDAHFKSVNPFFDRDPKNVAIARNYGLTADQMMKGGSRCMSCHGAVVTGRENREVNDGVGCESCHGPGAAYLKPHQEGDKAQGAQRSGYIASLDLGLNDLRTAEGRAKACVSCHYITEAKLLTAGHPSGEGFDYSGGITKIEHWQRPTLPTNQFASAVAAVRSARGPIPDVTPKTLDVSDQTAQTKPQPQQEPSAATDQPASAQATLDLPTHVHAPADHDTLGPARCVSCHQPQEQWWVGDPHGRSVDPFFDQDPKNVKIARLFGISADEMGKGNQICMDCHGSVITGRERRSVNDGVGCEDCHGPGKDYLKPHQEGDKSAGLDRSGYQLGLETGMHELKDLSVRAKVCADCHYIDVPRLLSAGHPSGKGFDYVAGMKMIDHWQTPLASANVLHTAFADYAPQSAVNQATAKASENADSASQTIDEQNGITLPALPAVEAELSIEEKILRLKERLELLRRSLPVGKDGD